MKTINQTLTIFLFLFGVVKVGAMEQSGHVNGTLTSKEENPLAVIKETPGLCGIFHKWGFIGDSLCSGEHEAYDSNGKKLYIDLYEYSWGQRICAATGTKGENFSQGGEDARGWIDHFWDHPKNRNNNIDAKKDPKMAYIIALGVNDTYRGYKAGNCKKDIDLKDYTKNDTTFAGYYGGIIQRIKSIQPKAKIFVVTRPKEENTKESFNEVIREMSIIFNNVYVIDLYKYAPSYEKGTPMRQYFMGGHQNAAGYQLTAYMFMTYIDWIIRHHMKDFEEAAFIGTDYQYGK